MPHQLAINPPPRVILSLILIVGMMTIVHFGEQMIVNAMNILVFPFVAVLMLPALYLITQWSGKVLETLSFDSSASTGNGLYDAVAGYSYDGLLLFQPLSDHLLLRGCKT